MGLFILKVVISIIIWTPIFLTLLLKEEFSTGLILTLYWSAFTVNVVALLLFPRVRLEWSQPLYPIEKKELEDD